MNTNKDGTQKSLANEPGIPELMRLYLDNKYDYSNGTFTDMSEETEKQFRKDLKLCYTAFTGSEEMPDTIKKFSDIKLRDYSKKPGCQPPSSVLKGKYTLSKKDKLYVKYAENIKKMIQSAADNQYKLLEVINELFTYVNDPYSGKRVIRINPKLTDTSLQKAVEKTRKLIIDLYIKCESDYVNGVQLFEAIVESKARFVYTGAKGDSHLYEAIERLGPFDGLNLCGITTVRENIAVYRACDLFLGVDPAPMHMAPAAGVPVVALFGPTDERKWGPWGTGHMVVSKYLSCHPCKPHKCGDRQCMERIESDDALRVVEKILLDRKAIAGRHEA